MNIGQGAYPTSVLSRPEFHNEEAAFAHVESLIWPDAVACPHCGGMERITKVKANPDKRIQPATPLSAKVTRKYV